MADDAPPPSFLDRCNPNTVGRLDDPPAGAVGRSFSYPGTRALPPQWTAFAAANETDPACAGVPLGMTVKRTEAAGDVTTTVTVWWAA